MEVALARFAGEGGVRRVETLYRTLPPAFRQRLFDIAPAATGIDHAAPECARPMIVRHLADFPYIRPPVLLAVRMHASSQIWSRVLA